MPEPRFIPPNIVLSYNLSAANGRPWATVGEHEFRYGAFSVTVPTNFSTDLASVPNWLAWLYCPNGKHQPAAVFHDYLYYSQEYSRSEADFLFRVIMNHSGVRWWRSYTIYLAVRLFGWTAWREPK